jgi:hypothetical protein
LQKCNVIDFDKFDLPDKAYNSEVLKGGAMKSFFFLAWLINSIAFGSVAAPNSNLTPGALCTPSDSDFTNYDYPEHIARCDRNIGSQEKNQVAQEYGNIPTSQYSSYEFDHMIPLCAGGSNDIKNLWPQPIAQAHQKDVLENDICLQMKAGTLTQAQAVVKVQQWFETNVVPQLADGGSVDCVSSGNKKVHFDIIGDDSITHSSISVTAADGDHEAVHDDDAVSGKPIKLKSPLLKGTLRYSLTEKGAKDRFELFLPLNLSSLPAEFKAFVKIGFDGNYPELEPLNCTQ